MNKAGTLKNMRNRTIAGRVSLFLQPAFILSLFITCLCGPFCHADIQAEPEAQLAATECSGCCSSKAPEQQSKPDNCCNDGGNCECCLRETPDFEIVETVEEIFRLHKRIEIVVECFDPPSIYVESGSALFADPVNGPPPYLRFESLLI